MFVPENSLGDSCFFVILEDRGRGGGEENMGKLFFATRKKREEERGPASMLEAR